MLLDGCGSAAAVNDAPAPLAGTSLAGGSVGGAGGVGGAAISKLLPTIVGSAGVGGAGSGAGVDDLASIASNLLAGVKPCLLSTGEGGELERLDGSC